MNFGNAFKTVPSCKSESTNISENGIGMWFCRNRNTYVLNRTFNKQQTGRTVSRHVIIKQFRPYVRIVGTFEELTKKWNCKDIRNHTSQRRSRYYESVSNERKKNIIARSWKTSCQLDTNLYFLSSSLSLVLWSKLSKHSSRNKSIPASQRFRKAIIVDRKITLRCGWEWKSIN